MKQDIDNVEVASGSPLPGLKVLIVYCLYFSCNRVKGKFSWYLICYLFDNISSSHNNWMNHSEFREKQLKFLRTKCLDSILSLWQVKIHMRWFDFLSSLFIHASQVSTFLWSFIINMRSGCCAGMELVRRTLMNTY